MSCRPRIVIQQDDLSDGNIVGLLRAHRNEMLQHSPPESVHALDTQQLRSADITFWSAWLSTDRAEPEFAGCGALKELGVDENGERHGELKSMKTEPKHVRKGVAKALLCHIINYAREPIVDSKSNLGAQPVNVKQARFHRLSLETGTQDVFIPARTLYQRHGFNVCEPFADYQEDPVSVCMTLRLTS